ncbi:MAG: hypothetical protein GY929_16990, partial [Actinomycetia bacterium]|nr:hypothetical protein [Actinomycetes bacterium]
MISRETMENEMLSPDLLEAFELFNGMTEVELEQSAALFERIRRMAGERVTREADYGYS